MKLHILVSCWREEDLPNSTLVFKSLRVGFPNAEIHVWLNTPFEAAIYPLVVDLAFTVHKVNTIHHKWIEELVLNGNEPFVILDTDVILYSNIERFQFTGPLAGYRIPEFKDEFSRAVTRARLHPSLLYMDPVKIREGLAAFQSTLPSGPFTPFVNPFYPVCLPFKERMYFYDTCSLLYHAIGGQAFTDEQKDSYCHLHFGTIEPLVLPRLNNTEAESMKRRRKEILLNPELGRGAWREQEEYYAKHQL